MTALLAAVRAIHFASLMAIFGGSAYAALLRRAGLYGSHSKATRTMFAAAATLAIVSGMVWLCLIAGQMSGNWRGSLDPVTVELTATATRFGHIFAGRIAGLVILWFICVSGTRSQTIGLPVLAGLLLASLGPVSHAAANGSNLVSAGAISDSAHLLTAGFWVGGLIQLAMFIRQRRGDRAALAGGLRVFSFWGMIAVAILVVSGLVNAISILPVADMSLHSLYFDLLAAKVGLASVMIGLAALNRWRLAPALQGGGQRTARHLATSVGSEILLGLAVVAIASLLGTTAPH